MWLAVIGKIVIILFLMGFALRIVNRFFKVILIIALMGGILYLINEGVTASIVSSVKTAGIGGEAIFAQSRSRFPEALRWLYDMWYNISIKL
jgi:uncharacterized membrane protein